MACRKHAIAALKWELGYLALSALDTQRNVCEEANPLFGKRPSAKTLIITKLGGGLAHSHSSVI